MATTKSPAHDGGALKNALVAVAVAGVVASVISFFLFGGRGFVGSACGGAIAVANLWAVSRIVRGLVEEVRYRARWSLFAVLKLTLLIGLVFALVTSGVAPILPLAIGYAALPVGVVIGQLWTPAPAENSPLRDEG
jgi:hypothetical protein